MLAFVIGEMTYQFLAHVVDIKRSNLIDKLVKKNVLSPGEGQRINEKKKTDAKVDMLMMMLRVKSAEEFENFLATLSETGQQSAADVVHQTLQTVGQTGQNPLRHLSGKPAYHNAQILPFSISSFHQNNYIR